MNTYQVHLTIVDSTEVCAESVEEAEQIAWDVFKETGHDMSNAELDTDLVAEEEI